MLNSDKFRYDPSVRHEPVSEIETLLFISEAETPTHINGVIISFEDYRRIRSLLDETNVALFNGKINQELADNGTRGMAANNAALVNALLSGDMKAPKKRYAKSKTN